ncbi:MAG: response regulator [Actinomycetota bacterium]
MTKRVMVVDDEEDIREVAQLSLVAVGGFEVIPVGSGLEALDKAVEESPDAILLDVMMPGQDGPDTFASLRADPRTSGIPVVFLTAKAQTEERTYLESLGAAGVLAKPFDPMGLANELSRLLGWS